MLPLLIACSDVQVTSTDDAPVVDLLRPADGSGFLPTEVVELCANVDDEAGLDALEITLASSVDGILEPTWGDCDGGNLGAELVLSDADHLLTLSAVDGRGQAGVATATVLATDNAEPSCELLSPVDEDWVELGESWLIKALVDDGESGAASLLVEVGSDLDGLLWQEVVPSNGEIGFNWTPANSGDHLLTLLAVDPRGLTSACQVGVYVDPCLDEDDDGFTTCDDDCDDLDDTSHPGGTEVADGADNDCDGEVDEGTSLGDDDGDGFTEADGDCDDTDADIHPDAEETPYDGIDQDCSDGDADDLDSDGYAGGEDGSDCDDDDASVNPGATETWYDGTDQDCDGASDYDADGDGHDSDDHSGDDCDDGDASISPSAGEVWYDGTDSDCDGASDYDQDGDGYLHSDHGGDDCDDTDADVNPGETETWYDGTDRDCDGASDYDQDGDGDDHEDYGGADCDDDDSAVHSSATESRDGKDNDCDDSCDEGLLSSGDLIVSELMKDPSKVSDDYGEWFEVYNTTSTDITLCASWIFEDDDGDSFALSAGTRVSVPAGDTAVLGRSSDTSINGGATVDYAYATGFRLANGADEVVLVHDGSEIDRIEYDDGVDWPDTSGRSLSLDPSLLNGSDNDDGSNWCSGSSSYGDGDKGTPAGANDSC